MKIFLSWSGENSQSHQVAQALRNWLPRVIQQAKPWLSSHDMDSGINWSPEVDKQLSEIQFGVLVITRDSMLAPWLLFEAGALSKHVNHTYVCPFLCGIRAADLKGPLSKLQSRESNESGTLMLLQTINKALPGSYTLADDVLKDQFQMLWPTLKENLLNIEKETQNNSDLDPSTIRSDRDILEEILQLAREKNNHQPYSDEPMGDDAFGLNTYSDARDLVNRMNRLNNPLLNHPNIDKIVRLSRLGSGKFNKD